VSEAGLIPLFLRGAATTAWLTAAGILLAALMAFAGGTARCSSVPALQWVSRAYISTFRGTSLLVQLFWLYYALPMLGLDLGAYASAILALGLNVGAYGAEVVRGAIEAVPKGQWEAATALSFTPRQRMWRIILPQAIPAMIPPFGNNAIELLKGTALVSLITIHDLTFNAQVVRNTTGQTGAVFGLVLLIYLALALVLSGAFRLLERRVGAIPTEAS
jgi:polar amino acid transport system permease protein